MRDCVVAEEGFSIMKPRVVVVRVLFSAVRRGVLKDVQNSGVGSWVLIFGVFVMFCWSQ